MPTENISSADVLKALAPIWTNKHDTAKRVRQRLAAVFDWAKAHGHCAGENPVIGTKAGLVRVDPRLETGAAKVSMQIGRSQKRHWPMQRVKASSQHICVPTSSKVAWI